MKSQRILTHLLGMAGLQFDWLEFSSKTTYKYQHIFLSEKVKTSQNQIKPVKPSQNQIKPSQTQSKPDKTIKKHVKKGTSSPIRRRSIACHIRQMVLASLPPRGWFLH